jgi:putative endonuclease
LADNSRAEMLKNKNMFTVYVLRSLKNKKRYVGYTSKEALERLEEHNHGHNKWTRTNKPFKMIHTEDYLNKTDAMKREHFLKSGQGRKWLDENINK